MRDGAAPVATSGSKLRMLTLYTTPLSANGRKPLAVAQHRGLPVDVKLVNVYRGEGRRPEYLAINPSGKIPALVDGDFVLTESNAIIEYLAEASELFSCDAKERADIARWLFWEASEWQPALSAVLGGVVGHALELVPKAQPADFDQPAFRRVTSELDAHLAGRRFIALRRLTVADFAVAAMLTYAKIAKFPFESYSNVAGWYAEVESTDAWKSTATAPWA